MAEFYELDLINDPIEELYIFEHCLSKDEQANRTLLHLLSLAICARQATGDTVTCYNEQTEHAQHPDGKGWIAA